MAIKGANPFTSYVRFTNGISPPSAHTMAFWYQNTAVPSNTGTNQDVVSLSDATLAYNSVFAWHHGSASFKTFFFREAGGAYQNVQIASSLSANTWYHIGLTYDGTNIKVWLNGVVEATTAAAVPTGAVNPKLSLLSGSGGTLSTDDGTLAEVGLWTGVALASSDMLALAKGFSPQLVYPTALAAYLPLVRDIFDQRGNALQTSGDTTVQTHTKVYYPCSPGVRWGAAGADMAALSTSLSIGMVASPASSEMVALGLNANAAATLVTVNPGPLALSLQSGIKMKVVSRYIATGRARDIEGR